MAKKNRISCLEPNTRMRVLETAIRLFAEKGYAGTSVREIVERAGVSKPVLYYYFQSKEGLFYAILEWATEIQQKVLNEIFAASGSVQNRLIFLYRRIRAGIQQYQDLYKMIHSLIYGPPQGAPPFDFFSYQRRMFDAVKKIYADGAAAGEIRKADADEVAYLVLSLIDFSLNIDAAVPAQADPQRPERLLRLAFQGLGKK